LDHWILQGVSADEAVCIANLIVDGNSHGPHAFVMKLRDVWTNELVPGVGIGDMYGKAIGNDLDKRRRAVSRGPGAVNGATCKRRRA
jgi:acyl-CoA oxidase